MVSDLLRECKVVCLGGAREDMNPSTVDRSFLFSLCIEAISSLVGLIFFHEFLDGEGCIVVTFRGRS